MTVEHEHGKIEGSVEVADEFVLHGMVTGDIRVVPGGLVRLHGMCSGNLIVEDGGEVLLYGMVSGSVYNRGGRLEVWGMIVGDLHKEDGDTVVHDGAAIQGTVTDQSSPTTWQHT